LLYNQGSGFPTQHCNTNTAEYNASSLPVVDLWLSSDGPVNVLSRLSLLVRIQDSEPSTVLE